MRRTTLSIFTPTYNRAYILKQSYDALCRQTVKDFVWLVVDDGSTDNTDELISLWKKEEKINIKYIKQNNAGKQRAVNTGVLNCDTRYFAFLDSDDYFENETVEKFLLELQKIKDNEKVAGVLARRGNKEKQIIGNSQLPQNKFIENVNTLIKKYNFSGDTCRAYKTDVLRENLYPEIDEKFILEDVMLAPIDRKYDMYIVNEVFSICTYLEDGYTKNSQELYKKNPYGYSLGINELTLAKRGFLRQVKATILYTTWCWNFKIKKSFENCKNKKMYIIVLPISILCSILKLPKWIYK